MKTTKLTSRRGYLAQSLKARADQKRSFAQLIADRATSAFGSTTFLMLNTIWFVVWIIWNILPGVIPFDPYPFGLLTMIVSLEAILLSIFVLISQNRAARVTDIREEVDLHINALAEQEITKVIELLSIIAKKHDIDVSKDKTLQEMLKPTNVKAIEESVEQQVNASHLNS